MTKLVVPLRLRKLLRRISLCKANRSISATFFRSSSSAKDQAWLSRLLPPLDNEHTDIERLPLVIRPSPFNAINCALAVCELSVLYLVTRAERPRLLRLLNSSKSLTLSSSPSSVYRSAWGPATSRSVRMRRRSPLVRSRRLPDAFFASLM